MSRAASPVALITEVELALLAGRNLEQIEAEILARCDVDEDSQAAAWLYAWCREDRLPGGQAPVARATRASRHVSLRIVSAGPKGHR
jgi:hypothetical protein